VNIAVGIVVGFFALVAVVSTAIRCDSCTNDKCPTGHDAVMIRQAGYYGYQCACVVRPR
jgi:hypothetical protein